MSLRRQPWGLRIWNNFVGRGPEGSLCVLPFASPKNRDIQEQGWHGCGYKMPFPAQWGNVTCAGEHRLVSSAQKNIEGERLLFPGQSAAPRWIHTNMESCVHADSHWGSLGVWSNTPSWELPPACFLSSPLARMPAPTTPTLHPSCWHGPRLCTPSSR